MTVLNVILVTLFAMLGIALMTIPLIVAMKGWEAWQALPKEVYAQERQQIIGLRPITMWVGLALLAGFADISEWLYWPLTHAATQSLGFGIIGVILSFHLIWAIRLLRRRSNIDPRLSLFARYTAGGSAIALLLLIAGTIVG